MNDSPIAFFLTIAKTGKTQTGPRVPITCTRLSGRLKFPQDRYGWS